MSGNDLSLSALGSVSANAGVTGVASAGLHQTGSGASFEQELQRQTEADDAHETTKTPATTMAKPAAAATATPASTATLSATAAADLGPDNAAAKRAAGGVTDDLPADWLALLDRMRAHAEARPARALTVLFDTAVAATGEVAAATAVAKAATGPAIEPVATLAAPSASEQIAVAASGATPIAPTASVPAKETARETRDPISASALDGALPVLFAPLPTLPSVLQTAGPAIEVANTPVSAALKSVMPERLAGRTQPARVAAPDPGEFDAITAHALAAATPQPPRPTAAQIGAANAPDPGEPDMPQSGLDALAQTLPAPTGMAGPERLAESVPVQRHVATPMGQRGWDQAVSQQVSWLVRDQLQSANLSLNPPHLGPIQVTLQLDQQQATVQFVSAAPEVRQALQDALPALRAMLGEAGIALGQADVGSRQPERERTAFQRQDRRSGAIEDEPVEAQMQPRAQGGGLLNLFA